MAVHDGPFLWRDAAKDAKLLLDLIRETKHAASALSDFKTRRADDLPKTNVSELEDIIRALECVHNQGRRVARVRPTLTVAHKQKNTNGFRLCSTFAADTFLTVGNEHKRQLRVGLILVLIPMPY